MMDDLDSRMQRVLDAARDGMTPSAANTERTRRVLLAATAGLAVGAAATTAASTAAAATTAAAAGTSAAGAGVATASKGAGLLAAISSLSLGSKVVTAVAFSATIGTAGMLATQIQPSASKPVAPIAAPAKPQPIAAPIVAPPVPQPELLQAEVAAQPQPAPVATPRALAPAAEKREALTPDPLTAELALIERARQGLKSGDPQQALTALNEHGSRFPNGVMAQERRALRALALCSLGDPRGNQEAQRFLQQNPGSPLASHLRTGCK